MIFYRSIDFSKVDISVLGGGLKGFTIASPLGAWATGATVAVIGTAENILDSAIAGDSSPEALKRAVVTGVLEGVTAGGLKRDTPKNSRQKIGGKSPKNKGTWWAEAEYSDFCRRSY